MNTTPPPSGRPAGHDRSPSPVTPPPITPPPTSPASLPAQSTASTVDDWWDSVQHALHIRRSQLIAAEAERQLSLQIPAPTTQAPQTTAVAPPRIIYEFTESEGSDEEMPPAAADTKRSILESPSALQVDAAPAGPSEKRRKAVQFVASPRETPSSNVKTSLSSSSSLSSFGSWPGVDLAPAGGDRKGRESPGISPLDSFASPTPTPARKPLKSILKRRAPVQEEAPTIADPVPVPGSVSGSATPRRRTAMEVLAERSSSHTTSPASASLPPVGALTEHVGQLSELATRRQVPKSPESLGDALGRTELKRANVLGSLLRSMAAVAAHPHVTDEGKARLQGVSCANAALLVPSAAHPTILRMSHSARQQFFANFIHEHIGSRAKETDELKELRTLGRAAGLQLGGTAMPAALRNEFLLLLTTQIRTTRGELPYAGDIEVLAGFMEAACSPPSSLAAFHGNLNVLAAQIMDMAFANLPQPAERGAEDRTARRIRKVVRTVLEALATVNPPKTPTVFRRFIESACIPRARDGGSDARSWLLGTAQRAILTDVARFTADAAARPAYSMAFLDVLLHHAHRLTLHQLSSRALALADFHAGGQQILAPVVAPFSIRIAHFNVSPQAKGALLDGLMGRTASGNTPASAGDLDDGKSASSWTSASSSSSSSSSSALAGDPGSAQSMQRARVLLSTLAPLCLADQVLLLRATGHPDAVRSVAAAHRQLPRALGHPEADLSLTQRRNLSLALALASHAAALTHAECAQLAAGFVVEGASTVVKNLCRRAVYVAADPTKLLDSRNAFFAEDDSTNLIGQIYEIPGVLDAGTTKVQLRNILAANGDLASILTAMGHLLRHGGSYLTLAEIKAVTDWLRALPPAQPPRTRTLMQDALIEVTALAKKGRT